MQMNLYMGVNGMIDVWYNFQRKVRLILTQLVVETQLLLLTFLDL